MQMPLDEQHLFVNALREALGLDPLYYDAPEGAPKRVRIRTPKKGAGQ